MASVAVQSGLQLYLKQINDSPLLTADQEKELGKIGDDSRAKYINTVSELAAMADKAVRVSGRLDFSPASWRKNLRMLSRARMLVSSLGFEPPTYAPRLMRSEEFW